ncbi:MAG: hypothetical protein KF741_02885 [Ferruginibacter sp.]|nr:hypothetical protein [Bacteroidota bacterium]MBX2918167.1 hypothetical protein [Ferruginibacter sp.]MCC7379070.1 hypothetical protein [Chitinophagaceae bacterium]
MKKVFLMMMALMFLNFVVQAQKKSLKGSMPFKAPCTTLMGSALLPTAIDTTQGRNVANNDLIWENGDVILVKFMDDVGSQSLRNMIMQYAKSWEQYANITFKFVPDNTPVTNIRIKLGSRDDNLGHNSQLGIACNNVPQYLQTLNLDTSDFIDYKAYVEQFKKGGPFLEYLKRKGTNFNNYTYGDLYRDVVAFKDPNIKWNYSSMRGTTEHEFGHALGLLHEQSYPNGIKWNKDTVYKYYAKYQGWNKAKVDFNVLEASDIFYTNGTSYDPLSIMHYPVYAWQTLDGFTVGSNTEISEGDKKLIAALYPKDKKISDLAVPKIQITNIDYGEIKTDNVKKGLLIYPSFDIQTSALLGTVYFVARLTTEDGMYYIPTTNENYSWNKMAATYVKMRLMPSTNTSFNKNGKKNLELFFPFKDMPDLKGQKVKIEFSVYQDDVVNNRYQKLTFNFLSSPVTVPGK